MSIGNPHDPRTRLVREKYFSLRPKPLERWLWAQGVPPAAERVFWLHWQEGLQRGDWSSEVPLKRVALECQLDLSTVTRAYQVLQRMGCIRRTDPGRDPANPFQQATAVTEVRVPRELLIELDRHPSRRSPAATEHGSLQDGLQQALPAAAPLKVGIEAGGLACSDPFPGGGVRGRLKTLATLINAMSAAESSGYRNALSTHQGHMTFDVDSALTGDQRASVLQFLAAASAKPLAKAVKPAPTDSDSASRRESRKLTVFELARLKRDIQGVTSSLEAPELTRQVVWSLEEGALRRFSPVHAIHIALKKIREGAWSRPNRMPPNWARSISAPAGLETCRRA